MERKGLCIFKTFLQKSGSAYKIFMTFLIFTISETCQALQISQRIGQIVFSISSRFLRILLKNCFIFRQCTRGERAAIVSRTRKYVFER